jgi:hypothetical protein
MDGENTKTHSTTIRIRYDEIWMEKILKPTVLQYVLGMMRYGWRKY